MPLRTGYISREALHRLMVVGPDRRKMNLLVGARNMDRARKVYMFDKNEDFVKEYMNADEAGRENGSSKGSIRHAIKNQRLINNHYFSFTSTFIRI